MFPTSTYARFQQEILDRYSDYEETDFVTFGILLADVRQTEAREYILNYLNRFDRRSGKFFDFFIPGYDKHNHDYGESIKLRGTQYFFNSELFDEFCDNLENDFSIHYTFNPMLILMTMKKGYKGSAQYVIIELDEHGQHGVKRSGELFEALFEAARSGAQLNNLRNSLVKTYLKGNLLESITNAIAPNWLCEINKQASELKRYRIY